ncbi:hypothetical protein [Shewanella dokdonensis]
MSAFGNLSSKFDQLSRRERVMVAGVCWVLIAVLLYLPMESLWLQYQRQQQQLHSVVNLRQGNSEQIALLQQRLAQDPNQALHQQIDTLQQQIVALDQRLNSETVDLIPAARMPALLTKLLQQSQG